MRTLPFILGILLLAPIAAVSAEALNTAHTTTDSKDEKGADVVTDKSTSIEAKSDGSLVHKSDQVITVDPKGLNNKETTTSSIKRVDHKNGDFEDSTTTNKADGTYEEKSVKKQTKKHWFNKGTTDTTTRATTVDPKGLGNKQSVEVTEKNVSNPDGSGSKTVTNQVNGKTVSESTVSH